MECCCLNTKENWFKKWRLVPVCAIILLLCYLCIFMMNNGKMDTSNLPSLPSDTWSGLVLKDSENLLQNLRKMKTWEIAKEKRGSGRMLLGGPGSTPPRCNSKCGLCTPCKPVHVPVPPGTRVTTEYYPEAWRCKCGNKLYMP